MMRKLSDLCIGGGSYGIAASAVEHSDQLPTYLRITDIKNDGTIDFAGLKSVDDLNADKYFLLPNDIVFARTGASTGRNYFYDGRDGKFVYAGFLIKFSIDPSKVNPLFVKYYCQSKGYYDWVASFNTGSTRGNINAQTLGKMPIPNVPRHQQNMIADTLSALDDRIAENRVINNHLEQMAQAIFKSWFVDFEPFGGVMPEDWRENILDDLCSLVVKGITPKYDDDSDEIVINQKCIRNHAIDVTFARRHIPKVINDKWLRFGDILINSTGEGTLGRAAQFLSDATNVVVDSHVTIVRPKESVFIPYLGLWCLSRESLFASMSTGSTGQSDLPRERLKVLPVIAPDKDSLQSFNEVITPLLKKRIVASDESSNLATLRDALLPRLMSGELSVACKRE